MKRIWMLLLIGVGIALMVSSIYVPAGAKNQKYQEVIILNPSDDFLQGLNGKVIEKYPSYVLAKIPEEIFLKTKSNPRIISARNMDYIGVPNYPFYAGEEPKIPSYLKNEDTNLLIVKFHGPPKAKWINEISKYGEVIGYIPYNAVLLKSKGSLPKYPFISYVGKYYAAYKIDNEIMRCKSGGKVKIMLLKDSSEKIYFTLKRMGIDATFTKGFGYDYIVTNITYSTILRISKSDSVLFVERYIPMKIYNDIAHAILQGASTDSTVHPVWNHGLYGDGQIIGEADTGIDYDHTMFRDVNPPKFDDPKNYDLDNLPSPDLNHRKIVHYWTFVDDHDLDSSGHGTHVAGSIAGNATPYSSSDAQYNGQAPSAKISFVDIGYYSGNSQYPDALSLPDDLNYLFYWHYHDGARIASNSWGGSNYNYTTEAMQVDQFMWNHPDFLILFANGNDGDPDLDDSTPSVPYSVGSPATAKNCISVGALGLESIWNIGGQPIAYSGHNESLDDIADFSSRGPTGDGRIKPTIVSPGVLIDSADSDGDTATNNDGVISMDGTSMATPNAAGAIALIREYFMNGYYPYGVRGTGKSFTPSAALLKAMAVNSADQVTGRGTSWNPYNGMYFPSNDQGFGRLHLDNVLYFPGDSRKLAVYDYGLGGKRGIGSGDVWETNVYISSSSEPLKITLTWTDYPALPMSNPALVNDLDLIVIAPNGTEYHGNVFSGDPGYAESVANPTSYDRRNTVEEVWIENPSVGAWKIKVVGYDVSVAQPFALVVTGGLDSSKSIKFDKLIYGNGESAKITVTDLSAVGSVTVHVSSDSDTLGKDVTLSEVGNGIFEGYIVIGSDVQVNDGDRIYANYSGIVSTAYVDVSAPIISNLTVDALDTSAIISWDTSEYTNYTLWYGTSTTSLNSIISESDAKKSHSALLYNLTPNTTYYFRITVWDRVNNSVSTSIMSFTTQPLADILVVDDGEKGFYWVDYWKSSLRAKRWRFSIWYYYLQGRPSLSTLQKYKAVIWDTSNGYPPIDDDDVNLTLKPYLDDGGRLMLVGQDIGWAAFDTQHSPWATTTVQNFLQNYMKITWNADSVGNPPLGLAGVSGDPVGDGISDNLVDTLGGFYPDDISNNGGIISVNYSTSPAKPAVIRYSSTYRSIFVAFAFQDMQTSSQRDLFVDQAIIWLLGNDHPDVTVSYPNGGETLSGVVTIQWSATDDSSVAKADVYYSDDGGKTWHFIGSTTTNSIQWDTTTVANGNNYLIRVIVYDDSGLSAYDISDGPFTIDNGVSEISGMVYALPILMVFLAIIFRRED